MRWTLSRKLMILHAIRTGKTTETQVMNAYPDLSKEELDEWMRKLDKFGKNALKATNAQAYR